MMSADLKSGLKEWIKTPQQLTAVDVYIFFLTFRFRWLFNVQQYI